MEPTTGRLGRIAFSHAITTGESWAARFEYSNGVFGSVFMIGEPGTTVAIGTGPRYEYSGTQPHLAVRRVARRSDEVVFLVVHETYRDSPEIVSIESLNFDTDDRPTIGLRIFLRSGAVGYVVHSLDSNSHATMDPHDGREILVDDRFAHLRTRTGSAEWMFLVEDSRLRYERKS